MSLVDWVVFAGFLLFVVIDGVRRGRGSQNLEGYFAGGRGIAWWAAGLSIMATQASAITVIGTTGQGCESGMEFIQQYIGLAFAMVLLSIFFVPLYHRQPILTAYSYLEGRFGPVTRTLAAACFLLSRCLAFGVVLYTPSVVLSATLEWDLTLTVLCIGAVTTVYTTLGGVKAVIATDVKQMLVILGGLVLVLVILLTRVVPELGFLGGLEVLGATGKLNAVEFAPESLDFAPKNDKSFWSEPFNFWSGMFGGLFLMLSYFGCDQSQVQRILTNSSADESRKALLLSAFAKVPMQAGVLFIGVLLYLFYVLNPAPLYFNAESAKKAMASPRIASEVRDLEQRHAAIAATRRAAAIEIASQGLDRVAPATLSGFRRAVADAETVRAKARKLEVDDREENRGLSQAERKKLKYGETNYIFPYFILREVPVVFLGLIMAAIFAAMMSSADSALNSLTSSSIVDIYRRWLRPAATEAQALYASKITTVIWGAAATIAALSFKDSGSVILLVNKIGSYFYGSLLGVFVLAMAVRRAGGWAASSGLLAGMASVLLVDWYLKVGFLWYNLVGCVAVLVVGVLVSLFEPRRNAS